MRRCAISPRECFTYLAVKLENSIVHAGRTTSNNDVSSSQITTTGQSSIRNMENRTMYDSDMTLRFLPGAWRSAGVLFVAVIFAPAISPAQAPKSSGLPDKTVPIRATANDFVSAFNKGDAKAVAALWTATGTETDEQGTTFKGRQAIEEQYAALFKAQPDARIAVEIHSIDMPAPNVAVEDGIATVMAKGVPPSASRYTAVHVLEGGRWQMASVHEAPVDLQSNASRLQDLDWLIGKWQAKSGDVVAESNIRWLANKAFIERDYTVRKNSDITSSGMQIIGWDPQEGQIRSWSFDSSGGYGTGLWSRTADGWQVDHTGTLPDSTPTAALDFVIQVPGEDGVFGWRSTNRTAGQSPLPDTAEVVFDRVKDKP
jgi:uncharacterized protein (TIGR02246 family)